MKPSAILEFKIQVRSYRPFAMPDGCYLRRCHFGFGHTTVGMPMANETCLDVAYCEPDVQDSALPDRTQRWS